MNKPILITGATSGIGKAAARALSSRGHDVFAGYRDPRDRTVHAQVPGVHPVQLDVGDPTQIRSAVSEVEDAVGAEGLFAVINNAGITYMAPFEYAQLDQVRQIIDVNLVAPYLVAQACIPMLRRYNEADAVKSRVVNIASWAGMMAAPFVGFYNATKFGLTGLTESMYYDLGLLGIHVVLANPGVTKTPLLARTTDGAVAGADLMPAEARAFYLPYLKHVASMGEGSANSRMLLTPEQVACKIAKIVDSSKPRFEYNLAMDAKVVDGIMTRIVPFRVRAALNRRMYRLGQLEPQFETRSEVPAVA